MNEVYLQAAAALFLELGYAGVDLPEIDRLSGQSAEGATKEQVYQAAMKDYVDRSIQKLEAGLSANRDHPEEGIVDGIYLFIRLLEDARRTMDQGNTVENRLVMLDIREQVTARLAEMLPQILLRLPWIQADARTLRDLSAYLAGGMGQMIYQFVFVRREAEGEVEGLVVSAVDFAARTIGAPKLVKSVMLRKVKSAFRGN